MTSPRSSRAPASSTPPARTRSSSSASASGALRRPSSRWRATSKNLYAATLAKLHRRSLHDRGRRPSPVSRRRARAGRRRRRREPSAWSRPRRSSGSHTIPRIHQMAMLEGDRFEILDIIVREDSELVGKPFRELPLTGSLIGAIVRDGDAIFPHGNDMLLRGRPRDRLHRGLARRRRRAGAVAFAAHERHERSAARRYPARDARRRSQRGAEPRRAAAQVLQPCVSLPDRARGRLRRARVAVPRRAGPSR